MGVRVVLAVVIKQVGSNAASTAFPSQPPVLGEAAGVLGQGTQSTRGDPELNPTQKALLSLIFMCKITFPDKGIIAFLDKAISRDLSLRTVAHRWLRAATGTGDLSRDGKQVASKWQASGKQVASKWQASWSGGSSGV